MLDLTYDTPKSCAPLRVYQTMTGKLVIGMAGFNAAGNVERRKLFFPPLDKIRAQEPNNNVSFVDAAMPACCHIQ